MHKLIFNLKKEYGKDFFNNLDAAVFESANNTLPLIVNFLKPQSVVDLGCGQGAWLKVFQELGVKKILGVEGEYVKGLKTYIPKENFQFHDLQKEFITDQRFDLAISLEVGEHLKTESSQTFIKSLCNLSDIILFSAAIKGQEGTMHINEQLPEYWSPLFKNNNFVPIDWVRPKIWNNKNILVWYRQNIILYANETVLTNLPPDIQSCQQNTYGNYLFRIHPELYFNILKRKYPFHFTNYWWNKFKRSFKKY